MFYCTRFIIALKSWGCSVYNEILMKQANTYIMMYKVTKSTYYLFSARKCLLMIDCTIATKAAA